MEKPCCKRCNSDLTVKRGFVRQKQRWLCKSCGLNFVMGDERCRTNPAQKALACLLVCLGLSFRAAGLAVGVVRNTVMEWFKSFADEMDLPAIEGKLDFVEYDEMWHFLKKKRTSAGSGKPQRLLLVQLDSSMSKWGIAAVTLSSLSSNE